MSRLHLRNWDKSIGKKSHHHVATQFRGRDIEEDIVGSNRILMLRQKCKLRTPLEVETRNSCHNIKMS